MRGKILGFVLLSVISLWFCAKPASAYSIKVDTESFYSEEIPDYLLENVDKIFRKEVKKAMNYHKKYKDADWTTYAAKIPYPYFDFIQVAKQIKASDKLTICYPFYIYQEDEKTQTDSYRYYFFVTKNKQKLCIFSLDVDPETSGLFAYDRMMNDYFDLDIHELTDENYVRNAIYYRIKGVVFSEVPGDIFRVRDEAFWYTGEDISDDKLPEETDFYSLKYAEKKKIIHERLQSIQTSRDSENTGEKVEKGSRKEGQDQKNAFDGSEKKEDTDPKEHKEDEGDVGAFEKQVETSPAGERHFSEAGTGYVKAYKNYDHVVYIVLGTIIILLITGGVVLIKKMVKKKRSQKELEAWKGKR